MNEAQACSGHDLVTRVLDHPRGGVQALLDLAGNGETDWLEFKAAMVGRPQDRKNPKENDADGHWNVAEAVLAMANSRGGAVIVGIDDAGSAIGLSAGDPRKIIETKGLEAFRRMEIQDRIKPPNGPCKWATGLKGTWELRDSWPLDQFEIRAARIQDLDLAVIVVKPVPVGQGCLFAWQDDDERLLMRVKGNLGEVQTLRGSRAIREFEQGRSIVGPELFALWERFRRRVEEGGSESDDLEASIAAWHEVFRKKAADLLSTLTPLDAEEHVASEEYLEIPVPKAAFEPRAEELLPKYLREDFGEDFVAGADTGEDEDADTDDDDEPRDEEAEDVLRPARRGGLFSLLAEEPRAVVVGEPGGGKTTCLRCFALEAALDYQPGGVVTLFVPLTRWQAAGDLWSLIRRHTGLSAGQVERLITAGRCRLLLDALNECPDALRPAAVNALTDLLQRHRDLPVTVSARTPDTTAALHLPTFSVQPLSKAQQLDFLKAYLKDTSRAEELLARIHVQHGGEALASNPLLLRMIVEVALNKGDLPAGRAQLYRQWIRDWYKREAEKAKAAQDPLPWSFEKALSGLASMAFAARKQGLRVLGDDLALEALAGVVEQPARFLERLTQGPLMIREEAQLQFRHETFQEYLCAEALLANPKCLDGCGPESYATWGMPVAYAAELQDPLPRELMATTWRLSAWLGTALAHSESDIPSLPKSLNTLARWAISGKCPQEPQREQTHSAWYQPNPALYYAISTKETRFKRWQSFEFSQITNARKPQLIGQILSRAITLGKDWSSQDPKAAIPKFEEWLEKVPSEVKRLLVSASIITRNDYATHWKRVISEATVDQAVSWVKNDILAPKDLKERSAEFAKDANDRQVVDLVRTGILEISNLQGSSRKLFDKVEALAQSGTPESLVPWVEKKFIDWERLVRLRPEWVVERKSTCSRSRFALLYFLTAGAS